MNFLYANNGTGMLSSLMGSWVFWILVILIVVLIVLMVVQANNKSNADKNKGAVMAGGGGGGGMAMARAGRNADVMDEIREEIANEINYENSLINNGAVADFNKYMGDNLSEEMVKSARYLNEKNGPEGGEWLYHIKRDEEVFKIDEKSKGFALVLVKKIEWDKMPENNTMKLYNSDLECMCVINFTQTSMEISSNSPTFEDTIINIESQRQFNFLQIVDMLYLDKDLVAKFRLYDKISYFYISTPIIKELQYL